MSLSKILAIVAIGAVLAGALALVPFVPAIAVGTVLVAVAILV